MSNLIIHQTSWCRTQRGTPIELYKKSHKEHPQHGPSPSFEKTLRPFLFLGGVHGDEPEGVRLACDLRDWLLSLPESEQILLHPWILIPCINPDGYLMNQRTNSRGVDLNRNFPSLDWSPECKAPRYFPGTQKNSEVETQHLVQLIETEKPKAIFHFHSWEPCVVYTGNPGAKWAQIIGKNTPYPVREDIGYPTPGSLGQYGWQIHQIPVICVEEQEHISLTEVWPHFAEGLKSLLRLPHES